ncbi:hypothetical protein [Brevundimonas viscosa]|uniref:hypothetical protein n=1 Tax=Brevundimonas viscosa TaxID=871741 RepID=UPI000A4EED56|nr:hypothetical protein [Brevundimonas viscosa]
MMTVLHAAASLLIGFLLLTFTGNSVCRRILIHTGLQKARDDLLKASAPDKGEVVQDPASVTPGAGAWIGGLERMLIAVGLITGAWEILAAVIALKTVARFKEIDQQIHAEYFLVGSLFSIVWAFGVSHAWRLYDASVGPDLLGLITRAIA